MNLIPDDSSATPATESAPKQAELYENLRRIGELEDKKQEIQTEISALTEQLRSALDHLDTGSLLHQMLSAALAPKAAPAAPARTKATRKGRKKVSRKKATKKSARKK